MALPTNLPLLDYNIYGSPLLPQAKSTIDLELLDFGIYAQQFAANNIATGGANFTLTVDAASYALTFNTVNLRVSRRVAVDTQAYTLTLNTVNLTRTFAARTLTVDQMALAMTANDVALRIARRVHTQRTVQPRLLAAWWLPRCGFCPPVCRPILR